MARTFPDEGIPRPPPLKPTWITWVWIAFAVAVLVATVLGLWYAGKPFWA